MDKPSNAQLAQKVADDAADLFLLTRDDFLSIEERNWIFDAVYRAFNSATVRRERRAA